MPVKTPVSQLQEFCVKHRMVPIYSLIIDGTTAEDKVFAFEVEAFDLTAEGRGRNKNNAKHEAAANLISLLRKDERYRHELSEEIEVPRDACPEIDAVSVLMDICVERNLPLAQFKVQQAHGCAHAPEFVVECQVASIIRVGKYSTKKGAKQLAAKAMLAVFQNISNDEQTLQIAKTYEVEPPEKIFKRYYKLKETEVQIKTGVKMSHRYMYFVKLDKEIQDKLRKVLFETDETDQEKLYLVCNALECKYSDTFVANHPKGNIHCIEIFCDYDLCFANTVPEVYTEIMDYLKVALSFQLREM